MISIETKRDGELLHRQEVATADVILPPIQRSEAAAQKVHELMMKESISLEQALERPEVLEAARNADITAPVDALKQAEEPPPAESKEQPPAEPMSFTPEYRRYLMSILNQRRESFDDLTDDELQDILVHPRFAGLRSLSFEAWINARG